MRYGFNELMIPGGTNQFMACAAERNRKAA